jgi:hypothetical protein
VPIAAQANKAIKACLASTTAVTNVAAAKKVAAKCLKLVAAPVAAFKAVPWGPYTTPAAAVSKAIDRLDGYLATMRDAKSVNALLAAYQQTAGALTNLRSAANMLRTTLGLPKVPASSYT